MPLLEVCWWILAAVIVNESLPVHANRKSVIELLGFDNIKSSNMSWRYAVRMDHKVEWIVTYRPRFRANKQTQPTLFDKYLLTRTKPTNHPCWERFAYRYRKTQPSMFTSAARHKIIASKSIGLTISSQCILPAERIQHATKLSKFFNFVAIHPIEAEEELELKWAYDQQKWFGNFCYEYLSVEILKEISM